MTDVDAFPLQWPAHWPRTNSPQRAQFDTTMAAARDGVLRELRLMGVSSGSVVISTDIPLRMDGLPKANRRVPDDPGVAGNWSGLGTMWMMRCSLCWTE